MPSLRAKRCWRRAPNAGNGGALCRNSERGFWPQRTPSTQRLLVWRTRARNTISRSPCSLCPLWLKSLFRIAVRHMAAALPALGHDISNASFVLAYRPNDYPVGCAVRTVLVEQGLYSLLMVRMAHTNAHRIISSTTPNTFSNDGVIQYHLRYELRQFQVSSQQL